jgi:zinc resistance-associated protein
VLYNFPDFCRGPGTPLAHTIYEPEKQITKKEVKKMKKLSTNKILVIVAIIGMAGFAATAFADWGMGPGHRGWGMGYGPHYGMMDDTETGYGPGYDRGPGWCGQGYAANLSEEDLKKVDEARQVFFDETKNLRQNIYQKELELRSEFAKENPDAGKLSRLQKELSEFESQLDQKRINYMLKMRKINPDAGRRGWGPPNRGYARGPGFGGGCR